jgi:hypothetical protein
MMRLRNKNVLREQLPRGFNMMQLAFDPLDGCVHTYIYIYIYTHVRVCNIAWAHLYTINIYKPVMAKTCKNCLCSILHGRLSLFGSRLSSPQDPAHGNIDPKYMGNLDFRWCFDWGIWMCHRISASFRCTAASVPLTQASAHAWRLSHPKKKLVPYETTHSPCHRLYDNRAIWQTAAISSSSLYRNRPWRHQIQEAITRLAANYWLECSRVWPSTLICLHIKLHTFLGMRRNWQAS